MDLSHYFKKSKDVLEKKPTLKNLVLDHSHERYGQLEFIAEGGQKEIYKAYDYLTGREVALAFLKEDGHEELFLRESRITSYLQHPYILPIYDVGVTGDGRQYYSMKLIEGSDLSEAIRNGYVENSSLMEKVEVFLKVCEAIDFAHKKGVLHLDIKPSNIELSDSGEVLVLDWGLARIEAGSCDEESSILDDEYLMESEILLSKSIKGQGTPGYMAPEMLKRTKAAVDARADIYSLGAVFYKILFARSYKNKTHFIESGLIPYSLQAILEKMLKDPLEERYASVTEVIGDLKAFQSGHATVAESAGIGRQLSLFIYRHIIFVGIVFVLIVAFGLSQLYFIYQLRDQNLTLLEQKQDLKEAVDKYQREKTKRDELLKVSAKLYVGKMMESLHTEQNYQSLLSYFEQGKKLDPDLKLPSELQGLIYLIDQQIVAARDSYRKDKDGVHLGLTAGFARYADENGYLAQLRFRKLIERYFELSRPRIAYILMDKDIRGQKSFSKLQDSFRYWLLKLNRRQKAKDLRLNFKELDPGFYKLSFTGGEQLENFAALRFLAFKDLDLSNSRFHNAKLLVDMPLSSLNLSKTQCSYTSSFPWKSLKSLDISYTRITRLLYAGQLPRNLETLNIRGCKIHNLHSLLKWEKLKKVYLHKSTYPDDILKALEDNGVELLEHDRL